MENIWQVGKDLWFVLPHNFSDVTVGQSLICCQQGGLVYLEIFGTSLLYINSSKLATELLDHRGSIYSNRFSSTMFALYVLMSCIRAPRTNSTDYYIQSGLRLERGHDATERYLATTSLSFSYSAREKRHWSVSGGLGKEFKVLAMFHAYLAVVTQTKDQIDVRKLLQRLYRSPELFLAHIRHTVGANIMEVRSYLFIFHISVYESKGHVWNRDSGKEWPIYGTIRAGDATHEQTFETRIFPGWSPSHPCVFLAVAVELNWHQLGCTVKYVPSWFPGANFIRIANDFKKGTILMRNMPFNFVKKSLVSYPRWSLDSEVHYLTRI